MSFFFLPLSSFPFFLFLVVVSIFIIENKIKELFASLLLLLLYISMTYVDYFIPIGTSKEKLKLFINGAERIKGLPVLPVYDD